MEDFDHLLCEKHLNNETLELISAGKFKENGSFQSNILFDNFAPTSRAVVLIRKCAISPMI